MSAAYSRKAMANAHHGAVRGRATEVQRPQLQSGWVAELGHLHRPEGVRQRLTVRLTLPHPRPRLIRSQRGGRHGEGAAGEACCRSCGTVFQVPRQQHRGSTERSHRCCAARAHRQDDGVCDRSAERGARAWARLAHSGSKKIRCRSLPATKFLGTSHAPQLIGDQKQVRRAAPPPLRMHCIDCALQAQDRFVKAHSQLHTARGLAQRPQVHVAQQLCRRRVSRPDAHVRRWRPTARTSVVLKPSCAFRVSYALCCAARLTAVAAARHGSVSGDTGDRATAAAHRWLVRCAQAGLPARCARLAAW